MKQPTPRQSKRERFRRAKRLFLWLFPVEVIGEFPDTDGPMIIYSNHNSPLDGAYLWALLRRRSIFLVDSAAFSARFAYLAVILAWTGQIPVNNRDPYSRGNPHSGASALRTAEAKLKQGGVIGIQPEADCQDEGQLVPFGLGITRLALHPDIRDRVTLVGVGIQGSGRVMRFVRDRPRFFRRIRIVIGEPIRVVGLPNTPHNRRQVRRRLEEIAAELSNQRPPTPEMYRWVAGPTGNQWR